MSTNLQLNIPDKEILPHHTVGSKELICELRKTPTVLYGLFVELVRGYYLNGQGYLKGTPEIKWDSDPNRSGIWIDSELNWNDEHPEFRPAIFVRLGELQSNTPLNPNSPVNINMRDAVYYYARQVSGSVSFVHVAQRAGEALILCDNTAAYLTHFASQIRDDFCFTRFTEVSRTPIMQAQKESSERYMSQVTYAFSFGETWSSKLESPILKVLNVNVDNTFYGQKKPGHDSINTDTKLPEL